ncbi:hypothetical protein S40288_09923 [Stachybotrys chartarum IBT 40288]|nr:hypothetical protein S40288_09923 [Stachybotrys chartarum IBT 40288]
MAPRATANRASDDRHKESTTSMYSIEELLGAARKVDFDQLQAVQGFQAKYAATLRPRPEAQALKSKAERKKMAARGGLRGESDNVLHKLSTCPRLTQEHRALAEWLIRTYPEQLKRTGEDEKTPLFKAIEKDNFDFIRLVLDGASDPRALLSQTVVDSTCLYYAIQQENPFTCVMIRRCLESLGPDPENNDPFRATVSQKDWGGSTPLHRAVYIEPHESKEDSGSCQCTFESIGVIEVAGVNREAMEREDMSPVKLQPGGGRYDGASWRPTTGPGAPNGGGGGLPTKIKPLLNSSEEHQNTGRTRRTCMPYDHAHVIKKLIEADKRVLVDCKDDDGNTPFQVLLNDRRDKIDKTAKDKLIESDPVLLYMRSFIIENFGRNDAMQALYRSDERRALEFDLFGLPQSTITMNYLDDLGKILRFEQVLQYVALPRLSVLDDTTYREPSVSDGQSTVATSTATTTTGVMTAESKGRGLEHMCRMFKWLKKRGVTSIVKVTVIDDVEPSHSDEAIEQCLGKLDVRVWDWFKFDLCSDVIVSSANNVSQVTLYSSGNNAVLNGWSSPRGLASLPKGLESEKRVRDNMKQFRMILEASRKGKTTPDTPYSELIFDWKFLDSNGKTGTSGHDHSSRTVLLSTLLGITCRKSKWMEAMSEFNEKLRSAQPRACPVRIAVIDDGISPHLNAFANKIETGDSFYKLGEMYNEWTPFYVPSGPHGTHMARLICQTCPFVKLYIAKLEVIQGQGHRRSFNPDSAAEAIMWAVNHDVDIISMSWSIRSNSDLSALHRALKTAKDDKKIIMFCSSSDEGAADKDNTYPAKTKTCIKIGASTSTGTKLSWVSKENVNFLLPGDLLMSDARHDDDPVMNPFASPGTSGSSVSTALAAGVAGSLLYLDRLARGVGESLEKRSEEPLKQLGAMDDALGSLSEVIDNLKFVDARKAWKILQSRIHDDPGDWDLNSNPNLKKEIQSFLQVI